MALKIMITMAAMLAAVLVALTDNLKELAPFYFMGVAIFAVLFIALVNEFRSQKDLTDFNK